MFLLKCLDCGRLFEENSDGQSDIGQYRPACPRCGEEIDIEEVGEFDSESDSTGFPY